MTVLSLTHGRYFRLNRTATRVWTGLCNGASPDALAGLLAAGQGTAAEVACIDGEIRRCISDLTRSGLLERGVNTAGRRDRAPWQRHASPRALSHHCSPVRALAALALVVVCLKLVGLRSSLRLLCSAPATRPHSADVNRWLFHAMVAIAKAGSLLPLRAKCLELSLGLVYLARRQGIDARVRFGVVPSPFEGHAWVEYLGTPVNESADNLRLYLPFPELDLDTL